jgi:hypothetical protein
METREKTAQVRLTAEELRRLHLLASEQDATVSQLIRRLAREEWARLHGPDQKPKK